MGAHENRPTCAHENRPTYDLKILNAVVELMDFTGVEISYLVGEMFYKYTKEPRFAAPGLLRNMVKAGYLGRKTGRGFYDYSEKK